MSNSAAVLGQPIAHSLSPILHRAAYAHLQLDWVYLAFEVGELGLADFLSTHQDFRGFSLTMPLKTKAFELASTVNPAAKSTQAVNTLVRSEAGWLGYNTDVPGAENALRQAGVSDISDVLVLGAGATARSTIVAAANCFADSEFTIFARNPNSVKEIALQFPDLDISYVELSELESISGDAQTLLINTLPGSVVLDLEFISPGWLFDVTYAPWPTDLVSRAKDWQVIGGLDLLVHQAILQVELMTGLPVGDDSALLTAMYAAGLAEQQLRSHQT